MMESIEEWNFTHVLKPFLMHSIMFRKRRGGGGGMVGEEGWGKRGGGGGVGEER